MATITKIDITEYLLDKYQLQKAEAKALVEDFFEEIRLSLESGGEVKLSGFGNFYSYRKGKQIHWKFNDYGTSGTYIFVLSFLFDN